VNARHSAILKRPRESPNCQVATVDV
jgi:hypothetical protein